MLEPGVKCWAKRLLLSPRVWPFRTEKVLVSVASGAHPLWTPEGPVGLKDGWKHELCLSYHRVPGLEAWTSFSFTSWISVVLLLSRPKRISGQLWAVPTALSQPILQWESCMSARTGTDKRFWSDAVPCVNKDYYLQLAVILPLCHFLSALVAEELVIQVNKEHLSCDCMELWTCCLENLLVKVRLMLI